jgi:hypothetical protein
MPKGGNGGGGPGGGSGEIKGNKRDNILNGTEGADVILGLGGNDELYGLGGGDTLDGGTGDDLLSPGAGEDTVDGGAGTDTLLLSGDWADYAFEWIDATTVRVTDTRVDGDGVDLVTDVESFQFADQTCSFADLFRGPDLAASGLGLSATTWKAGDVISADWIVANLGDLNAGDSGSALYLSTDANVTTDDMLLVLDPSTGLLVPGGSGAEGGSFTVDGGLAPGTYWIAAIADTCDAVAEGDEGNNASAPIQITVAPTPNLVVSGGSLTDTSWAEGDFYTLEYTLTNAGAANAGGSYTRIYVSTDPFLDANDVLLTTSVGSVGRWRRASSRP